MPFPYRAIDTSGAKRYSDKMLLEMIVFTSTQPPIWGMYAELMKRFEARLKEDGIEINIPDNFSSNGEPMSQQEYDLIYHQQPTG
jgi:hypothetical protein